MGVLSVCTYEKSYSNHRKKYLSIRILKEAIQRVCFATTPTCAATYSLPRVKHLCSETFLERDDLILPLLRYNLPLNHLLPEPYITPHHPLRPVLPGLIRHCPKDPNNYKRTADRTTN